MKWILVVFLFTVLFLGRVFTPSYLVADPGPKLVVEIIVIADEAFIGDIVELKVRVTHPSRSLINVSPEFQNIVQPLSPPTINVGYQNTNQISTEFVWSLQFLSTTSNETVPVTIMLVDAEGNTEQFSAEFRTPNHISLLPPGQVGLNGNQAQESVNVEDHSNFLIMTLLFVFASSVLTYFAWRYVRRNDGYRPILRSDASPEGVARERLSALHEYDLSDPGTVEAFYDQISVIIRRYLVAKFDFPADSLTSEELGGTMVDRGIQQWQARLVSELLLRCDSAVFAKIFPHPESIDQDLTLAYEIIEFARGDTE